MKVWFFCLVVSLAGVASMAVAQVDPAAPLTLSPPATDQAIEFSDSEQLGDGMVGESSLEPSANLVETRFGDWFQVCVEGSEPLRCEVIQSLQMQTEQGLGLLLQTVFALTDQGLLVVQKTLPNGLDLRPGIAIQFGDFAEFNQPYMTCAANGCAVVYAFTETQLTQLLSSEEARIGFRPLNSEQTLVLDLSLDGLAEALQPLINP